MQINIACAINESYAPYMGVMLTSLFENNKETVFNVYILTQGLSKGNLEKIEQLCKTYQNSYTVIKIDSSTFSVAEYTINAHISIETYFRLILAEVLPVHLDKILYLDVDILVVGSILPLWKTDLQDRSIGASEDISKSFFRNYKLDLGLKKESQYFNAGVLLIDLKKWRLNNIFSKALSILKEEDFLFRFWDQDILNILFEDDITFLDRKWNYSGLSHSKRYYNRQIYDARIIHFIAGGKFKPWHDSCEHPYAILFQKYLSDSFFRLEKESKSGFNVEVFKARIIRRLKYWMIQSQFLRIFPRYD
ncbi:glycosyltransferase family 8 protein [Sediminitomix flava]|uniref:Lipopolysaccharide biosynthesis glycosyltransferase n=1 Tax=Sediminitomix flava TaxID=379075 RepID=A0A315ZDR4_SEDFL|nr:glycosyltransferase family 8 protein [Sediminitomix flava]PWJ43290.1 lipopolysaccharide biosynthesis glycosyltransferase [Sediminitomix flava]